jgi:hypothetical protein
VGIAGIGAGVTLFVLSLSDDEPLGDDEPQSEGEASALRVSPAVGGVTGDPYGATLGVRGTW